MLSIVMDGVVAALLVATIVYAAILSRKLGALRNDKAQLEALVRSLDESSSRAVAGIASLREAAEQTGQQLQQKMEQGQTLRADLTYIIELGGNLADRLEGGIRTRRDEGQNRGVAEAPARVSRRAAPPAANQAPMAEEHAVTPEPPESNGSQSRAERLLRRALDARR